MGLDLNKFKPSMYISNFTANYFNFSSYFIMINSQTEILVGTNKYVKYEYTVAWIFATAEHVTYVT